MNSSDNEFDSDLEDENIIHVGDFLKQWAYKFSSSTPKFAKNSETMNIFSIQTVESVEITGKN